MRDFCLVSRQLPLTDAPYCEAPWVAIQQGQCAGYLQCYAAVDYAALSAPKRGEVGKFTCDTDADGMWNCTCPALFGAAAESYTLDPGSSPYDTCAQATIACAGHVEDDGFVETP
jgi:hypothetical protein